MRSHEKNTILSSGKCLPGLVISLIVVCFRINNTVSVSLFSYLVVEKTDLTCEGGTNFLDESLMGILEFWSICS